MRLEPNPDEIVLPGGRELARAALAHVALGPGRRLLSVGSGAAEQEVCLAADTGCRVTGVELRAEHATRAAEKALAWGLAGRLDFVRGDGGALPLASGVFDAAFACGTLCAFFERGVPEIRRVLRVGGRLAACEIVWSHEAVPEPVRADWTRSGMAVHSLAEERAALERHGLEVVLARVFDEPAWWDAFYDARRHLPRYAAERRRFERDRAHFALAALVAERTGPEGPPARPRAAG